MWENFIIRSSEDLNVGKRPGKHTDNIWLGKYENSAKLLLMTFSLHSSIYFIIYAKVDITSNVQKGSLRIQPNQSSQDTRCERLSATHML
jgi:hypothetical protein